jgi:hypothetical protein
VLWRKYVTVLIFLKKATMKNNYLTIQVYGGITKRSKSQDKQKEEEKRTFWRRK